MKTQKMVSASKQFSPLALTCNLVLIICSALTSYAQDENSRRGFYPGGAYGSSDIERYNTINGNLILNIPISALPPGRAGQSAGVNLIYNSKLWDTYAEQFPNCVNQLVTQHFLYEGSGGGWRYGFNYEPELLVRASPEIKHRVQMIFPDGSRRVLRPLGAVGADDPGGYYGWYPSNQTYYSTDGSYIRVHFGSGSDFYNTPWTIYFPDGSRATGGNAPQRIYDRNNNYIEFQNITWNGHPATKIVDQLGRYMIIEKAAVPYDPGQDYVHSWGVGGQQMTWTIKWKTVVVNKTYRTVSAGNACAVDNLSAYLWVVDQIILPSQAGSLSYTFGYNVPDYPGSPSPSYGYGEVSAITLPTGAQASYSYFRDGLNNLFYKSVLQNRATGKTLSYQREYDGSSTQVTEFWGPGDVRSPDGGELQESFYPLESGEFWKRGLVYKSERPDGTVVERIWQTNSPYGAVNVNPYVKTEFTSIRDASGALVKTAIKDFNYDKNGNVTRVEEYDWIDYGMVPRDGSGNPTGIPNPPGSNPRVTINTYYSPTPDASDNTTDDPNVYHKTTSPNLRNAIASKEASFLGGAFSRAEFFYDNALTTGNLTEQKSWDSTKGVITRPLIPTNSISVTHQYDSFGNRTLTTDAKGIQTQLIYDPINGHGNLYVTQTKAAAGASVQRWTTQAFDFNTGLVTQSTDMDNSVTNETVYDVFGRPTIVKEAVGRAGERWTRTEYNDQARSVVVRAALDATDDKKLVTVQHYDQLGRVRLTRQLENPNDDVANEALGIKAQTRYYAGDANNPDPAHQSAYQVVSNPYRAATSSAAGGEENGFTMGWTRTKFDKGKRVVETRTFGTSLPQPWGSNATGIGVVTTEYDGEFTMMTDQANKTRRSMIDGMGRLARVDEPDSSGALGGKTSPVQPTWYLYDTLNNLIRVTHGSQIRTFSYSSLSRLSSAANPESGAVSYQYDNNGNLTGMTDARSVTTTITYDALNRPVAKTYAGGAPTPQVNYFYDQQALPAGAPSYNRGFARGRLVAMTYGGGSAGDYYGYDELGRINIKYQRINTTDYQIQATYNKAGGMTGGAYPSTRTVGYGYDNAGRLTSFSGTLGDGLSRTYATITQYNSAGQKERESYGTGANGMTTPLYLKLHYNRRRQMVDLRLSSVNDEWNLDRGALVFYYGANGVSLENPFHDDVDNNGNLLRQWSYVPKPGGGTVTPQLADYTYDSLKRVAAFTESQIDESGTLIPNVAAQTFAYDRFGNRRVTSATGGVSGYNPTYNTANNRIDGLGYDAAGNITSDPLTGGTMTYDAENRMVTATSGGGATYAYDCVGKRVKRTLAGGEEWWYVYGIGGELVAEYLASAPTTVKKEYGYRGGQLLVVWDADKSGDERLKWLVTDHLGSVRMEADKSGRLDDDPATPGVREGIRRRDYAPFGEELYAGIRRDAGGQGRYGYEPPQSNVRQRFDGAERDTETGLDLMGARYYSSMQGRFTSADPLLASGRPINPQSWNRYSFVLNRPLNLIDPSGLIDTDVQDKDTTDDRPLDDPNKKKVVVVVFYGGNAIYDASKTSSGRDMPSTTAAQSMQPGGSTEGIGETDLEDLEARNIAQFVKNEFPDADVILAGPDSQPGLFNQLAESRPDHIIIQGYSAGAISAVALTNNLTDRGQKVDQLTTVDPTPTRVAASNVAPLRNTKLIGNAVNYHLPGAFGGKTVSGATNRVVDNSYRRFDTTKLGHRTVEDVTSGIVTGRITGVLREIYKR